MAPKKTASSKESADPRRIVISQEEYDSNTTSLDNVQAGVDEFQTHGFAILENAMDKSVVEKIGNQMRTDAATKLEDPNLVFNHGNERNNFSVIPPLSDAFLLEDMWANSHATAIMEQIIGPKPLLCWASSNIAIKSSADARQAVHSDAYADIRKFPFCVEVNIYLQETTPENGSTELWPGTHVFTEEDHLPSGRGFIKKGSFNKRARICPPIQPTISAGSILMRDLRLWHAGMPNVTDVPRIIVALLYFPQWFRPLMCLTLPESVRPKVTGWTHIDLLTNTDFVEESVDHLRMHFSMNFTQDPEKAMVQYRRAKDVEQKRTPGAVIPLTNDNYWTPSRYLTRKRKREEADGGDGNGSKSRNDKEQKQEDKKSKARSTAPERTEATEQPKIEQPESEQPTATEEQESSEYEIEKAQEPKVTQGSLPTHSPQMVYEEPEIKNEPKESASFLNDLPDYRDSPGYPPDWLKKLQDDQAIAEVEPWIAAAQEETFKPNFMPFVGPGPGISPQFSPKSKAESAHSARTAPKVDPERGAHENLYRQQLAPIARMTTQSPKPQTPPPIHLTAAQLAWQRDPRPYKGPRPATPRDCLSGSPSKAPPHRPQMIPHVSPYCVSRCTGKASPPVSHHSPVWHPQSSAALPAVEPKATDAYDAYFQAQLLEKQGLEPDLDLDLERAAGLKGGRAERERLGPEGMTGKETSGDDREEEWLSVTETQERERGW